MPHLGFFVLKWLCWCELVEVNPLDMILTFDETMLIMYSHAHNSVCNHFFLSFFLFSFYFSFFSFLFFRIRRINSRYGYESGYKQQSSNHQSYQLLTRLFKIFSRTNLNQMIVAPFEDKPSFPIIFSINFVLHATSNLDRTPTTKISFSFYRNMFN